jgi:hypothetical protein
MGDSGSLLPRMRLMFHERFSFERRSLPRFGCVGVRFIGCEQHLNFASRLRTFNGSNG